jgi:hypothetical protein
LNLDARASLDSFEHASALSSLRQAVPHDSALAELHGKALRAYLTGLPAGYVGCVVIDFCERWLQVAPAVHEARPLVERLRLELRALLLDGGVDGREVIHAAADVARRASRRLLGSRPVPRELLTDRPQRRPDRHARQSRTRRQRLRVRSGSRGDPPDDPAEDPPDLGRAPRGRLGVLWGRR